ncbi:MAG: hypothetical protein P4N59_08790 [Negativicutes bacterium]|nr:hypothetical protein [Negativicutes bacterium]
MDTQALQPAGHGDGITLGVNERVIVTVGVSDPDAEGVSVAVLVVVGVDDADPDDVTVAVFVTEADIVSDAIADTAAV